MIMLQLAPEWMCHLEGFWLGLTSFRGERADLILVFTSPQAGAFHGSTPEVAPLGPLDGSRAAAQQQQQQQEPKPVSAATVCPALPAAEAAAAAVAQREPTPAPAAAQKPPQIDRQQQGGQTRPTAALHDVEHAAAQPVLSPARTGCLGAAGQPAVSPVEGLPAAAHAASPAAVAAGAHAQQQQLPAEEAASMQEPAREQRQRRGMSRACVSAPALLPGQAAPTQDLRPGGSGSSGGPTQRRQGQPKNAPAQHRFATLAPRIPDSAAATAGYTGAYAFPEDSSDDDEAAEPVADLAPGAAAAPRQQQATADPRGAAACPAQAIRESRPATPETPDSPGPCDRSLAPHHAMAKLLPAPAVATADAAAKGVMWGKVIDPARAKAQAASRPLHGKGAAAAKPNLADVKEVRRAASELDPVYSQPGQHARPSRGKRVVASSPDDSEGSSPEPKQAAPQHSRIQQQQQRPSGSDPPRKKEGQKGGAGSVAGADAQKTPAAAASKQNEHAAEPKGMHATPAARKRRRLSRADATCDMRTPAALRGQAQSLDVLVEAAVAAYSGSAGRKMAPSSPAKSPNSRNAGQPRRPLAPGKSAAAASPEGKKKGMQIRSKGDSPAPARKVQHAQPAADGEMLQTTARGRSVGRTGAKPWWVV